MLHLDLHCHSTASDGTCTPEELVFRAKKNSAIMLAITDHDEIKGIVPAKKAAKECGIKLISGVEISVTWNNYTYHVVGLQINENDQKLIKRLHDNRSGRIERAQQIGEKFDKLGIHGAFDGAMKFVTNPELISRKHFGRFLFETGRSSSIGEAFRYYLKTDGPCYVKHEWASLKNAINWIHDAGGVAIVAHPGRYRVSERELNAFLDEFKQLGGTGIEVVTGSHASSQYTQYAKIANYYGFLASVGSDFHSPDESLYDVGLLPELPHNVKPIWLNWL